MKRRYVAAGAAIAVVAGGGAAALVVADGKQKASATPTKSTATANITRGDLVDTSSVDGKLTYADERKVNAGAAGTATWVPAEGSIIKRGQALLRVDRKPVTLMYGKIPLYRPLSQGITKGPDIKQLEENLRALGYGESLTVDEYFSSATAAAVREWQEDNGLEETGNVDAGQVVILTGEVRVADTKVAVGDRVDAGREALTVTGTRRLVHVDLDVDHQDVVRRGATVTIELPGGKRAAGKIISVGTVAKEPAEDPGGAPGDPTIDVDIELTDAKQAGNLDQAPVSVELESDKRENVLSVPIEALLALREGGFGIEVVDGTSRRIVAVQTGVYGGGRVEVSGAGLREGMKVGVPAQ